MIKKFDITADDAIERNVSRSIADQLSKKQNDNEHYSATLTCELTLKRTCNDYDETVIVDIDYDIVHNIAELFLDSDNAHDNRRAASLFYILRSYTRDTVSQMMSA